MIAITGRQDLHPLPETIFEDGDTVHLAVLDSASNSFNKLFN